MDDFIDNDDAAMRLAQVQHAGCNDLEAGLLEAAVDLANHVLLHAVGFDNGKSAFDRHGKSR